MATNGHPIDLRDVVMNAIKSDNTTTLQKLIDDGFTLESENYICLMEAVERGNLSTVRMLLNCGDDPNCSSDVENTSLYQGIFLEEPGIRRKVVEFLINTGPDLRSYARYEENLFLHEAVEQKDAEVVQILCDAGANVHSRDDDDNTPLHCVLYPYYDIEEESRVKMVKALINHGADVNACCDGVDTPMTFLAESAKPSSEIAKLLIDAGYQLNAPHSRGMGTPLYIAAREGHFELVKLMIEAKADVNSFDNDNKDSPLLGALSSTWQPNKDIVQLLHLLLENGADANIKVGEDGYSALDHAVRTKYRSASDEKKVLKMMLARSTEGNRAETFVSVLSDGSFEAMKTFFKYGGFTLRNCSVTHPLHRAATNRDKRILEYLLKTGFYDVNEKDGTGSTALFQAVRSLRIFCVKVLIDWGADPNIPNTGSKWKDKARSRSPLSQAVSMGNREIADLLLAAGAEANLSLCARLKKSMLNYLRRGHRSLSHEMAACLLGQFVLAKTRGHLISETNEALLRGIPDSMRLIERSEAELEQLKATTWYGTVTLYDILIGKDITRCVNIAHVIKKFESLEVAKKYTIYGMRIRDRYLVSQSRQRTMNKAVKGLKKIFNRFGGFHDIYFHIMLHLPTRDLHNLCVI